MNMDKAEVALYKKELEYMPNDDLLFEYGENYVKWREAMRIMAPKQDLEKKGDLLKIEMKKRLNLYEPPQLKAEA